MTVTKSYFLVLFLSSFMFGNLQSQTENEIIESNLEPKNASASWEKFRIEGQLIQGSSENIEKPKKMKFLVELKIKRWYREIVSKLYKISDPMLRRMNLLKPKSFKN